MRQPVIILGLILLLTLTPLSMYAFAPENGEYGPIPVQQDTIEVITASSARIKRKPQNFDLNLIAAPHYSQDIELGVGIAASGIYSTNRPDSLTPPSNISLFGDISITGFYLAGITGSNIFPQEKWKIDYNLLIYSLPGNFWGIGYSNGTNDNNMTKFVRLQMEAATSITFRLARNLYTGATLSFNSTRAKEITPKALELLNGELTSQIRYGAGITISYDSRDFIPNPYKGVYAKIIQKGYTNFEGKPFWSTDLTLDFYRKICKGGVLALDLYGLLQYGDVPWSMKSALGGTSRMRGYYKGRYRDDNLLSIQMEYRQRIWSVHGIAAWIGGGTVWGKEEKFSWSHILPNYGIGYRLAFKDRINIRLDYGFGKRGEHGFIFSLNEAF